MRHFIDPSGNVLLVDSHEKHTPPEGLSVWIQNKEWRIKGLEYNKETNDLFVYVELNNGSGPTSNSPAV